MAGGQPFSLANLQALRSLCNRYNIKIFLDATRAMENAWFISQRESGHLGRPLAAILKDMCALTDGCIMSGKKDLLVNMGGFLALRDKHLYDKACEMVVLFEGLHTYGGMSGRDMEAMARGIEEAVADDHMRARIGQVEYLAQQLLEAGVPIVQPTGGHAVYLDARRFLPHIPQEQLPAQALTVALYVDSGVRTMERGIVSAGRNPVTGDHNYPKLELVRLTIPRRVYTQSHLDVVAYSVIECHAARERIAGYKMTYEPEKLRFFQAHFQPVATHKKVISSSAAASAKYPQPALANNHPPR
jgi:tyrosine phenol-lyase